MHQLYNILNSFIHFPTIAVDEITGPRGRYSAAHEHFSDKPIEPIVIIVFFSVVVFLLVAMIVQHHHHMKQIHKHNADILHHHKELVKHIKSNKETS